MLHVSLMPSWRGLELLSLVSNGGFTWGKGYFISFWLYNVDDVLHWLEIPTTEPWTQTHSFFSRYCHFICHSEGPAEETSLRSSVEPACFNRFEINPNTQKAFVCAVSAMVLKGPLLSLSVASSLGSYAVTRWETQKCSDLWMLLETGKVPDRTPPKGEYSVWL